MLKKGKEMKQQKPSDINKIRISRKMSEKMLENKHTIALLPRIDSKNKKHLKLIANEWRTLKRIPLTFDFVANVLDAYKEKISTIVKDIDGNNDHFQLEVPEDIILAYFDDCSNYKTRQSLKRQLLAEMDPKYGFVEITGKSYCGLLRPIMYAGIKKYNNDTNNNIHIFMLHKDVFGSLVTGKCSKNGGDGFFKMPRILYPILTASDKRCFQSYNPFYRLIVYGLTKNTNDVRVIKVDKSEFCQYVMPEYYDLKRRCLDMKYCEAQDTFFAALKNVTKNIKDKAFIVKNLFMEAYKEEVRISFETINND